MQQKLNLRVYKLASSLDNRSTGWGGDEICVEGYCAVLRIRGLVSEIVKVLWGHVGVWQLHE